MMEVPDGWRRAHLQQPLDGPDGCRTRQHGSSGLKSTTGHREAALQHGTDHNREGGLYNDFQVRDPIAHCQAGDAGGGTENREGGLDRRREYRTLFIPTLAL